MVKTCEDFDIRQRSGEMIPGNIGAYSFDCPVDISEGDSDRNEQPEAAGYDPRPDSNKSMLVLDFYILFNFHPRHASSISRL